MIYEHIEMPLKNVLLEIDNTSMQKSVRSIFLSIPTL